MDVLGEEHIHASMAEAVDTIERIDALNNTQ
jgi:hypothetical protein